MERLKELLAKIADIESWTSDEVSDAREALKEFTVAVKAGEVEGADSEVIAQAKELSEALTTREGVIKAEDEARIAEIAALEESLGMGPEDDDGEDEAEAVVEEVPVVEVPDTPA